jgi:hypothetical protein
MYTDIRLYASIVRARARVCLRVRALVRACARVCVCACVAARCTRAHYESLSIFLVKSGIWLCNEGHIVARMCGSAVLTPTAAYARARAGPSCCARVLVCVSSACAPRSPPMCPVQ